MRIWRCTRAYSRVDGYDLDVPPPATTTRLKCRAVVAYCPAIPLTRAEYCYMYVVRSIYGGSIEPALHIQIQRSHQSP